MGDHRDRTETSRLMRHWLQGDHSCRDVMSTGQLIQGQ